MLLIARETESSVLFFTFIWFTIMVEPRVAQGWIHTLLEEAENERMHLMIFLELRHPGKFFRLAVLATQWIFTFGFSLSYLLSPALCHRFVGYLEEEAVFTYTDIISLLDKGKLPMWKSLPAPALAVNYYRLGPQATMRHTHHAVLTNTYPYLLYTVTRMSLLRLVCVEVEVEVQEPKKAAYHMV